MHGEETPVFHTETVGDDEDLPCLHPFPLPVSPPQSEGWAGGGVRGAGRLPGCQTAGQHTGERLAQVVSQARGGGVGGQGGGGGGRGGGGLGGDGGRGGGGLGCDGH